MQVDLSAVFGLGGAFLSIFVGIIVALGRITVANREKEIDRRFDTLSAKQEAMDTRLHAEEKATIRQDGDAKVVEEKHETFEKDLSEIKGSIDKVSSKLDEFFKHQRGGYVGPSGGSGGYQRAEPRRESPGYQRPDPSPLPPRPDTRKER